MLKTYSLLKCSFLHLFWYQCDIPQLAKGIEGILDVGLSDILVQASAIEGGDVDVLWRLQVGHCLCPLQQLLCHRVIDTVVTVLEVLLRKGIVGVAGFLVSVRAFFSSLALSLHPE